MGAGGRPKEYTAETLRRAVNRYFKSITRIVPVTEPIDTGQKDKQGHTIYKMVPVCNLLGKPVEKLEYIVPPSKGSLALFLGIHRSTWDNYQDRSRYPELADIVEEANARIQAWNEEQLLTRSGKDIKGIIFNLENNYGYRERLDTQISGVGEYLAQLDAQGEDGSF